MKKFSLAIIAVVVIAGGIGLMLVFFSRPAVAEGKSTATLSNQNCDTQEASFGNLTADALRDVAQAKVALVAAISFTKAGTLAPGPISLERVRPMLSNPDETWVISKLTGAQLREALEHAVRSAPQPSTSFLQVSGLVFQYAPAGERGRRVLSVRVGEDMLDTAATYRVAMPLSLAKGGSGFFRVFTAASITPESKANTQSLAEAIVQFAQEEGTVPAEGPKRITIAE